MTIMDNGERPPADPYVSKLLKLIPAEIIGVYLAVFNIISLGKQAEAKNTALQLIVFGLILLITPFYLKKVAKINTARQIIFCMVSFIIWVFSIGGPVEGLEISGYPVKFLGAVFLPVYSLLIPLLYD